MDRHRGLPLRAMIAIVAAVPLETELLRKRLSPCEVRNCGRNDLYLGAMYGRAVTLLHSGVGKANAAAAATALLESCRPSAVVVLGCGGAYPGSSLQVGDLALATEEIYGDEGAATPSGFLDMEGLKLPLVQKGGLRLFNRFPVATEMLETALPALKRTAASVGRKLATGAFVTVSTCSGTAASGREMARRTGGICENMEGAAVAQVCALYEIPFLEIRGISNLVEDRNRDRWNLRGGSEIAQRALKGFLADWPERMDSA